jgi:hypothetical protein
VRIDETIYSSGSTVVGLALGRGIGASLFSDKCVRD